MKTYLTMSATPDCQFVPSRCSIITTGYHVNISARQTLCFEINRWFSFGLARLIVYRLSYGLSSIGWLVNDGGRQQTIVTDESCDAL